MYRHLRSACVTRQVPATRSTECWLRVSAVGDDLGVAVPYAVAAAALSVTAVGARGGMPTAAAIDAALSDLNQATPCSSGRMSRRSERVAG